MDIYRDTWALKKILQYSSTEILNYWYSEILNTDRLNAKLKYWLLNIEILNTEIQILPWYLSTEKILHFSSTEILKYWHWNIEILRHRNLARRCQGVLRDGVGGTSPECLSRAAMCVKLIAARSAGAVESYRPEARGNIFFFRCCFFLALGISGVFGNFVAAIRFDLNHDVRWLTMSRSNKKWKKK